MPDGPAVRPYQKNMTRIYYDIETAPLPEAELRPLLPPFNAADVKLGNLKDAAKIAEKLKEAEANHAADFFERAALDPLTGRVVAIGALLVSPAYDREAGEPNRAPAGKEFVIIADDDEKKLLANFWALVRGDHGRLNPIIGFNSNLFDLPFLIRRSWKHGLNVPAGMRAAKAAASVTLDSTLPATPPVVEPEKVWPPNESHDDPAGQ